MTGASEQTRRVTFMNANWVPGPDGNHGQFQIMFVTDDDHRHVVAPSPKTMTALIALSQAGTILHWDPQGQTLIAANIVGTWITDDLRPSPPPP
jgi:hypothetical protein